MSLLRSRDGKLYLRIQVLGPENCDGCGNAINNYHNGGCGMEICPKCNGQLFSCKCEFVKAVYKVFDDDDKKNPLEEACKFASDKDVISISKLQYQGVYRSVLMVTVFYWR